MATSRDRPHSWNRNLFVRTFALFLLLLWGVGTMRQLFAEELTLPSGVKIFLLGTPVASHWSFGEMNRGVTPSSVSMEMTTFFSYDFGETFQVRLVSSRTSAASGISGGVRFPLARSQLETFPETASRGGAASGDLGGRGGSSSSETGRGSSVKETRLSERPTSSLLGFSEIPESSRKPEVTVLHLSWLEGALHGKEPPGAASGE